MAGEKILNYGNFNPKLTNLIGSAVHSLWGWDADKGYSVTISLSYRPLKVLLEVRAESELFNRQEIQTLDLFVQAPFQPTNKPDERTLKRENLVELLGEQGGLGFYPDNQTGLILKNSSSKLFGVTVYKSLIYRSYEVDFSDTLVTGDGLRTRAKNSEAGEWGYLRDMRAILEMLGIPTILKGNHLAIPKKIQFFKGRGLEVLSEAFLESNRFFGLNPVIYSETPDNRIEIADIYGKGDALRTLKISLGLAGNLISHEHINEILPEIIRTVFGEEIYKVSTSKDWVMHSPLTLEKHILEEKLKLAQEDENKAAEILKKLQEDKESKKFILPFALSIAQKIADTTYAKVVKIYEQTKEVGGNGDRSHLEELKIQDMEK